VTGHKETLVKLLQQHRWSRGAELGVDQGLLSVMLLRAKPDLTLVGVDNFKMFPDHRADVMAVADAYPGRFQLIEADMHDAAAHVPDGSLDFVFIDGTHTEAETMQDITDWRPKVRAGGYLMGDAYNPQWYPAVVRAVHRIFPKSTVDVHPGRVWGVWQ
jgi:predicted O-methyltransferase YrrM